MADDHGSILYPYFVMLLYKQDINRLGHSAYLFGGRYRGRFARWFVRIGTGIWIGQFLNVERATL